MEKNLGHATAYGYAKSKGYSGTEEEFAELMADYASVGQSAAQSAEQAAVSATSASGFAATASQAATTAETASESARASAMASAESASQASQSAESASESASASAGNANFAASKALDASNSASEASQSASTATQAKTDAITAKTDAEAARDAAVQSASEAAASAESIDPDEFDRKIYAAFATDTATGAVASFSDGADNIPMKDVLVHIEPVQAGSGDPSPDNVRPITGWTAATISHSGADMTNPTTYSIAFPSSAGTVYGGTLDVTKGELVVDMAMVVISGNENYTMSTNQERYPHLATTASNVLPAIGVQVPFDNNYCTHYKPLAGNFNESCFYLQTPANNRQVAFNDVRFTTAEEYKTYFAEQYNAGTPVTIYYKLATPITYQLTPQEITSLLGTNNVWADTGNSDVEYRADVKLYITKKITEAVSALS